MSFSPPNDPLPDALKSWRVTPARNPQFRSEVWARIEAAAKPATWTRFARAHPALVSGMLMAAVVFGAWSGRSEAREKTDADRAAIAAAYVHSLDARWMRHR